MTASRPVNRPLSPATVLLSLTIAPATIPHADRLRPAERPVAALVGGRVLVLGHLRPLLVRRRQRLEQPVQHREVVARLGGGEGLLYPVVPGDDGRVH